MSLLAALSVPVLFMGLGDYPVVNADEAFYHDVAWTMLETGDWWRVRTGPGEHVYDTFANAPLQYWGRGLVISLVGPGLFGMRILSALAALLSVLATYGLALRVAGRSAGLLAGLLLLANHQFVYLHAARTGELETGVTLLLVGLALLFVRAIRVPGAGFALHHLLLVALVGWKAPVAPIPLLAEGACFAFVPAARSQARAWIRTGLVFLPLALVWHGYQAWRLWSWLPEVIGAVGNQAAGGSAVDGFFARVLYYAERAWFGAWPQIALLPAAIGVLSTRDRHRRAIDGTGVRVVGLYLAAVVLFYCAISKVGPWYVVHAHPFVAVVVAIACVELQRRERVSWAVGVPLALGVASIPFVAPPLFDFDPFAASAIRIAMPVHVYGIGPWPALAVVPLVAVLVAMLGGWATRRAGSAAPVTVSIALAVVALSTVRVAWPLRDLARTSPVHALSVDLEGRRRAGAEVPLPIDVPPVHPWVAHYYFGHAFVLRAAPAETGDPGPPWQRFTLVAARDGALSPPRSRVPAARLPLAP